MNLAMHGRPTRTPTPVPSQRIEYLHRKEMDHVAELIGENWAFVQRRIKFVASRLSGSGNLIDAERLCAELCHCIPLAPRDEPALATLIYSCLSAESQALESTLRSECHHGGPPPIECRVVDIKELRRRCLQLREDSSQQNWRLRMCTDVPKSLQKITHHVPRLSSSCCVGPPYAVAGDGASVAALQNEYFSKRLAAIRDCFKKVSPGRWLTHKEFASALNCLSSSSGCSEEELGKLLSVLDPRGIGVVNVELFLQRFGTEFLKTKSQRHQIGPDNNDGRSTAFEWHEDAAVRSRLLQRRRVVREPLSRKRHAPPGSRNMGTQTEDLLKTSAVEQDIEKLRPSTARHARPPSLALPHSARRNRHRRYDKPAPFASRNL